jgi:hypothetical protein
MQAVGALGAAPQYMQAVGALGRAPQYMQAVGALGTEPDYGSLIPPKPSDEQMAAFAHRGPYGLWRLNGDLVAPFEQRLAGMQLADAMEPAKMFDVPQRVGQWPMVAGVAEKQEGFPLEETGLDWLKYAKSLGYMVIADPKFFVPSIREDDLMIMGAVKPCDDWVAVASSEYAGGVIVHDPGIDWKKWGLFGGLVVGGALLGYLVGKV